MLFINAAIFLMIFTILCIYRSFRKKYQYWQQKGVKVIEPVFPLGNILPIFIKQMGMTPCIMSWYNTINEKVIGLYAIDEPILLIKDPEIIKTILVQDFNYFTDRGVYIDEREPTAGHLWKLPGAKWRPLRTKMSTCFSAGKLKMMFSNLLKSGKEMEEYLQAEIEKGLPINVDDLSGRFSADIIASSIFGVETNSFLDKENDYFLMAEDLMRADSRIRIAMAALQIIAPNFFNIFSFIKFETVKKSALKFVYQMVRTVVEFRERTGTVRNDMMELLIQLKNYGKVTDSQEEIASADEKNTCLTMNELVAQAYTYFFVGSDTASSTLVLLLYEVAQNREIQNRLQNEIDAALKTSDGNICYDALIQMKYLKMVIAETLRKYPILGFLQRKAVQNYKIPDLDLDIDKGTRLYFSVQGLHWDPKYYPNPEHFDPERFTKENEGQRHSCVYLPFGEGPRNCIGKRLGFLMVALGAICIFRKFDVNLCEKTNIPLEMNPLAYTLKPKNPIHLKMCQRRHTT